MIGFTIKTASNIPTLKQAAEKNIVRNLYRTGGYLRTVSKRLAKKQAENPSDRKYIFYNVDRDAKSVRVEYRAPKSKKTRGNPNALPIRLRTARETSMNTRLSGSKSGLYYWIDILTAKQRGRGTRLLQDITGAKTTNDKKTMQEILNLALTKSSKRMMDIWGRHPLTA